MNRRLLAWLLVGMLLFPTLSCRKSTDEGRVLSEKRFAAALTDVYLTDAMLNTLDVRSKSQWQRGMKGNLFQDAAYRWVLEKHDITEDDFYASVKYYTRTPQRADDVFDLVKDHLKKMQAEVDKKEARERALAERLAYERKWKEVRIDSAYVARWGAFLSMDTLSLTAVDSVLEEIFRLTDICPDETLNDTVHAQAVDSLSMTAADSLLQASGDSLLQASADSLLQASADSLSQLADSLAAPVQVSDSVGGIPHK